MYVIASCITGLYFRELQTSGEEMKKPKVPFGTIYRRGKKGIFYFENRKKGINPSSLKTSIAKDAVEQAVERFGYLQFQDEARQQEYILQKLQSLNSHLRHCGSSIHIDDIYSEYIKALKRTGKAKGNVHVDASSDIPFSPLTIKSYQTKIKVFLEWLRQSYPDIEHMHQVTPVIADQFMTDLRERLKAVMTKSLCVVI